MIPYSHSLFPVHAFPREVLENGGTIGCEARGSLKYFFKDSRTGASRD